MQRKKDRRTRRLSKQREIGAYIPETIAKLRESIREVFPRFYNIQEPRVRELSIANTVLNPNVLLTSSLESEIRRVVLVDGMDHKVHINSVIQMRGNSIKFAVVDRRYVALEENNPLYQEKYSVFVGPDEYFGLATNIPRSYPLGKAQWEELLNTPNAPVCRVKGRVIRSVPPNQSDFYHSLAVIRVDNSRSNA